MKKNKENKTDSKEEKVRLVLLDSHAILHRAYHALPDFASSKGEPTGALYGLVTMLMKIIEELKPDYIVACYDLPKPTYRHIAYEAYKAGRQKTDDALVAQLKRSRDVFKAFSIPMYDLEGFEADDMLGTIVEILKGNKNVEIVVASGDMDTLQLVEEERVKVYTLRKGIKDTILYDKKGVEERYGFSPLQLVDYKGLRGDPSDNIIGIKGIGDKTGTNLVKEFGSIEVMYEYIDKENKKKSGEKFERFKKAGCTPRIIELVINNKEEALFSKMLATIRRDAPIDFKMPEKKWQETINCDEARKIFGELEFRSLVGRFESACAKKQGALGIVTAEEEEKLENKKIDEDISKEEEQQIIIALWLINSNLTNPKLRDALDYVGVESIKEAKVLLMSKIKDQNLTRVYEEIELPLIPIIENMEKVGIEVDLKYLKNLSEKYHAKLSKIEKEIWKLCGREFNVASPKQLGEVLFVELGLKAKNQKKTAGGAMSTKESELIKLKDEHPVISLILEYRELAKLLTTYIDTIPNEVKNDGRLHAKFIQAGTTTGRLSSEAPNLQNIPIKSDLGYAIRQAFVAKKGTKLLAIDYSQIQLRIAAILSDDPKLIEIFKSGKDIHTEVAREVFDVTESDVTSEMRRKAKVINFGIIYGMGVNALRANLGATREEAQKFYNEYFLTFKGLKDYLDGVKVSAAKTGFTETLFGRRRYFEGIKSKLPFIRAAAERQAINAPIQGTEADVVKLAMIRTEEFIVKKKWQDKVKLILQIHDELVYEVEESCAKEAGKEIKKIMEGVLSEKESKGVPIIANAEIGLNWGETDTIA